jgi:hypothetical protein
MRTVSGVTVVTASNNIAVEDQANSDFILSPPGRNY